MLFHPALEVPAGEENLVSASQANQSNIRTKPHHFPVISPAGMGFAQPDFIANLNLCKHTRIITSPCYNLRLNAVLMPHHGQLMTNLNPATLIARVITLIIALTVHEFSHAFVATHFGDDTPERAGRLTLNPLRHLDPMGSLMLVLVGFGWAKPVPINPYVIRQNNKAGVALVSLAGPFSNLLMAVLASIPLRLGLFAASYQLNSILPTPGYFLLEFIYTNVALFLFNMLPLAPLDGEKVLEFLLPKNWQGALQAFRQYGPFLLLALVFLGPRFGFDLFGVIIRRPLMAIVNFLIGG